MDLKQFEDNINRKFEDFEPEVDSLKIWDNIEEKLPSKSKPKYGLWFSLLLIPVLGYFAYTTMIGNEADIIPQSNETETFISQVKEEDPTQISETIITSENNVNSEIKESQTSANATNGIERQISNNRTKDIASEVATSPTVNNSTKNIPVPVQTFAEAKNTEQKTTSSKPDFTSTKQPEKSNSKLANQNSTSNNVPVSSKEKDLEPANVSHTKAQDDVETKMIDEAKETSSLTSTNESSVQNVVSSVVAVDDELEKMEKESTDAKSTLADQQINEEKFMEKRLSISLLAGVLGANRKYEQATEEAEILAIAEKETAEQQLETLQFEALFRYRITPKISLGVGVRNWKLSEKSIYTTESITEDFVDVATGYIHHPDNTIETMVSSVPITYYETVNNTRYQTHQSWSIPMRLYASIFNSEKFELEVAGGYEFSVSGKHIGYELEGNKTEYLLTLDEDNRYKNSGGDFLLLDINTNYKLKNSLALTAGLEGKYGLNGFNTETARFRKKYHFFGLYTGLTYSF